MVDIFTEVLPFTEERMGTDEVCQLIIGSGQVEIRDVAAGELPFEYSASKPGDLRFGPGYILIKALVAQDPVFLPLVNQLALMVRDADLELEGICGNVSGGMIPGYLLKLYLSHIYGWPVVYVYARETRKPHGSREMLVGVDGNPYVTEGIKIGDVEELVNAANTTCNAAGILRASGFQCSHGITILDYDNPLANAARAEANLTQLTLVTLPQLLDFAERVGQWPQHVINDYRSYIDDPIAWRERNSDAIQRALAEKVQESQGDAE